MRGNGICKSEGPPNGFKIRLCTPVCLPEMLVQRGGSCKSRLGCAAFAGAGHDAWEVPKRNFFMKAKRGYAIEDDCKVAGQVLKVGLNFFKRPGCEKRTLHRNRTNNVIEAVRDIAQQRAMLLCPCQIKPDRREPLHPRGECQSPKRLRLGVMIRQCNEHVLVPFKEFLQFLPGTMNAGKGRSEHFAIRAVAVEFTAALRVLCDRSQ